MKDTKLEDQITLAVSLLQGITPQYLALSALYIKKTGCIPSSIEDLLILKSFDLLAAFHPELLHAILFIAV
jgi:hypothetical protein